MGPDNRAGRPQGAPWKPAMNTPHSPHINWMLESFDEPPSQAGSTPHACV